MNLDVITVSLLALASLVAGFIDAIAGGGGLITLPALLLAGVPPAEAIATNKLQGTFGVASATYRYERAGAIDWSRLPPAIAATAMGAALGATAVTMIGTTMLSTVMPYALSAAALYFAAAPSLGRHAPHLELPAPAFAIGLAAPIGFYDGFFGPGAGSLYMLAFLVFSRVALITATAHTKVLNLTSNVIALAVFLVAGHVNFAIGLPMAVGQATGAWLGAHTALAYGASLIRPLLVAATLAVAARLILWP